jgi:hypothetical protein
MNDRELLENAARTVGVNGKYVKAHHAFGDQWVEGIDTGALIYWNPLANDGDALRLAVGLQLTVHNEHLNAGAAYCTNAGGGAFETVWSGTNEDGLIPEDYAATRRAIVLAAAEIGKRIDSPLVRADLGE